MYFSANTQTKVLDKFHFALSPRGLLVLGKADRRGEIGQMEELRRLAFSASPVAQFVLTTDDTLALEPIAESHGWRFAADGSVTESDRRNPRAALARLGRPVPAPAERPLLRLRGPSRLDELAERRIVSIARFDERVPTFDSLAQALEPGR